LPADPKVIRASFRGTERTIEIEAELLARDSEMPVRHAKRVLLTEAFARRDLRR
jgi:hypothetical protein